VRKRVKRAKEKMYPKGHTLYFYILILMNSTLMVPTKWYNLSGCEYLFFISTPYL
jgi:hypothetical protein